MTFRRTDLFILVLLLLLSASPALAETRYVVDQIVVNLRDSKASQYNTLKNLKTGTALEVLEEDSRFVKVRIASGEEGYILKQYVTKKIPSPITISRLEKERDSLREKLERLQQDNQAQTELKSSAEDELEEMDKALIQSRQELQALTEKYEDLRFKSEHIVQLAEERDLLDAEHSTLSAEVEQLRKETDGYQRSEAIRWFLAGGGVFFFGWLIGKISRKSRRDGFYR
ncbi:MAG: TIGR04211 family SH3 domain-containing protein [Desulfuromonas sp.]|nr:MAG: TIGR04211 family SH3 domain-containing protein [Desulfuromonas sp.]